MLLSVLNGDGGDELFAGYPRFAYPADAFPSYTYLTLMRGFVDNDFLPGALLRRSLLEEEMLLYQHVELDPWRQGRKSMYEFVDPGISVISESKRLWVYGVN